MNSLLLSSLIAAALGFGSAWQWQSYRMDAYKLEQADAKLAIEQQGRQAIADATKRVQDAQAAAQVVVDRNRRDAARADASASSLRDTLDRSVRAASVNLQTCTGQVTTLRDVLGTVVEAGGRIAKESDEWATQAVTLQQARPR